MHAWCWIWAPFQIAVGRSLRGQQAWHKCRQRTLPLSLTGLVSGRWVEGVCLCPAQVFAWAPAQHQLLSMRVGDDLRDKMNWEYLLSALPVNLHFLSIPTRDAIRTMRFASVQFHQFLINRLVWYNKRRLLGCAVSGKYDVISRERCEATHEWELERPYWWCWQEWCHLKAHTCVVGTSWRKISPWKPGNSR